MASYWIILLFLDIWQEAVDQVDAAQISADTEAPLPKSEISLHYNNSKADLDKNNSSSVTLTVPTFGGGLFVGPDRDTVHDDFTINYLSPKVNRKLIKQTRAELIGKTLKVVAKVESPYVNYLNLSEEAVKSTGYGPGVVLQILKELSKRLKVNYDFIESPDGQWGEKKANTASNSSWTGMIGMLERNEVDILAAAVIVRYDRHGIVDFSYPFMASETGLLIRSPDRFIDNRFLIITRPFHWRVWVLVATSILVSGVIFKGVGKTLCATTEVQYSIWGSMWMFFSVFVQQGLPVQPKSWACRTFLAFWWLAALTLVATFTGSMVALFAVDRTNLPFNSKEELVDHVEHKGYTVVMDSTTETRKMFINVWASRSYILPIQVLLNSQRQIYKRLWKQMDEKGKVQYVNSLDEGVQLVKRHPKYVLLGPKESLHVKALTDCEVTVLDGTMIPVWFSICLQKGSKYTQIMSDEIRSLVEKGFIMKWMNDHSVYLAWKQAQGTSKTTCIYKEGISTKGTAINLDRAQGAFWILIAGVVMGACGIFSEYIIIKVIRQLPNQIGCILLREADSAHHEEKDSPSQLPDVSGLADPRLDCLSVDNVGEIDMEGFSQIEISHEKYAVSALQQLKTGAKEKAATSNPNGFANGYKLKHRKINNNVN